MPKILRATRFGNPILRQPAKRLSKSEILSEQIQTLIEDMRHTLVTKKYGVGLAAPQVGESVALSIIGIKSTPTRPDREPFDMVMINPKIVETFGNRSSMWEGCISCGMGKNILYGKALRYKKVRLNWQDEKGETHVEIFDGLRAHVIQHETDHLNGVLFVDRVYDSKTYMMADEYQKRIVDPELRREKRKQSV